MPAEWLNNFIAARNDWLCKTGVERILTVDTGVNLGWALWSNIPALPMTGVERIPASVEKTREGKIAHIYAAFNSMIIALTDEPGELIVILESQELWGGSADSYASGSRGDLFLLSYITGACAGACVRYGARFRLLPAREWKGQMSKEVVEKRIARVIPGGSYMNHAEDAVGMGLSLMGIL